MDLVYTIHRSILTKILCYSAVRIYVLDAYKYTYFFSNHIDVLLLSWVIVDISSMCIGCQGHCKVGHSRGKLILMRTELSQGSNHVKVIITTGVSQTDHVYIAVGGSAAKKKALCQQAS